MTWTRYPRASRASRLVTLAAATAAFLCIGLLSSLVSGQQSPPHQAPCSPEALLEFVASRGVQISKVGIRKSATSGWGFVALEDVHAGDILMTAPYKSLVKWWIVFQDSRLSALVRDTAWSTLSQRDILALWLLRESLVPGSSWFPYVCMLPRRFTTPESWPMEYIQGMKNQGWKRIVLQRKDSRATRFRDVILPALQRYPGMFEPGMVTQSGYEWASMIVDTRAWGMSFNGRYTTLLTPFADLANHHNDEEAAAFVQKDSYFLRQSGSGKAFVRYKDGLSSAAEVVGDGEEHEMLLRAGRHYTKGEEVFVSYGARCNAHFLLNYGFSIPGNTLACQSTRLRELNQYGPDDDVDDDGEDKADDGAMEEGEEEEEYFGDYVDNYVDDDDDDAEDGHIDQD